MSEFSWTQIITDPEEIKVFQVLSRRTWRTLLAISRESGLPEEEDIEDNCSPSRSYLGI